jgi:serine/threonine-protein kinase RsbW
MDVVSTGDTAGEDLRVRVPANAQRLHQLRHTLDDWATRIGLAAEITSDLVLAAYEAMTNVVEHAYHDHSGGLLDLHAHADPAHHTVTVTVTDYGRWRPPPANPDSRGRGLLLIHGLTHHVKISPSQHGTTVTMTYHTT